VLTNSTAKSAKAQLEHAKLSDYFDEILSADAVERYKPAREPYEYAAKRLDVKPSEIRLVAAHGWDIAGALAAGCRAAFVQRPEKALDPGGEAPDIVGQGMLDVARQIVEKDLGVSG
jgi:2-haloacid dehalogenase